LTAAWAGALYFLERAMRAESRRAWWGLGICMGLGMLSKYTIALLGPATLVFMMIDGRARAWFRRPEPYLAAAIALLIFSPVIYWNLQHDWASFAFQSSRRIAAPARFALPALIVGAVALLTPIGLSVALMVLGGRGTRRELVAPSSAGRRARFIAIYTLVPLSVFVVFSVSHTVKINWTGPLWLAVLPAMSAAIVAVAAKPSRFDMVVQRLWVPTVAVTLVLYGLGLNYLVFGLPELGYVANMPTAWQEFGREAGSISAAVKRTTGGEPLLIGMDTYKVTSQLAFYNGKGAADSVGRGILGQASLMYDQWFSAGAVRGRPAILFALERKQLENPGLQDQFTSLEAPIEKTLTKNGKPAGRFYYRVGYGFLAGERPPAPIDEQPTQDNVARLHEAKRTDPPLSSIIR